VSFPTPAQIAISLLQLKLSKNIDRKRGGRKEINKRQREGEGGEIVRKGERESMLKERKERKEERKRAKGRKKG
jgi:hypothetical protein